MSWLNRILNTVTNTTGWAQLIGTDKTASKIRIDGYTSLTISSVWQAVNVIAGDVSQLPLVTYRRDADGDKSRDPQHPAYQLLKRRPNRFMTALQFKLTLQAHLLLWGNAYAHIQRDSLGRPIALWPLLPNLTRPVVNSDGNLIYETHVGPEGRRTPKKYRAANVLHLRGLGFDGLIGYSVITMARESFGLAKAAERHGATYFGNFATPQGILKLPGGKPTQEQIAQTKKDWKELHSGDNEQDIAILYGGMDYTPLSMSNKDSQFLESRQFQRADVASWFNLPPHKVGDLSRATFSNIEEQNRDYLNTALMRWLCTWQEECGEKLLSDEEKESDSHYLEFNTAALLRGDTTSRFASYAVGIVNGWLSRNEVRAMENLNRIEGLDDYLVPLNMGSGTPDEDEETDDEQTETEPPESDDTEDEIALVIRAAIKPLLQLEANKVQQKAETAKNFCTAVEDLYRQFPQTLFATLGGMRGRMSSIESYCHQSLQHWLTVAGKATSNSQLQQLIAAETETWATDRSEILLILIQWDRDHDSDETPAAA